MHCPRNSTSSQIRIWKYHQATESHSTADDHIFSRTSHSGYYTQELNTEIVGDAKFKRREEALGTGQTKSKKSRV